MFTFKIRESEVKTFMHKLLIGDIFDEWEARDIDIIVFTRFQISGAFANAENDNGKQQFSKWSEIKDYAFHIIKSNKTPKNIKIIFSLPGCEVSALHPNAAAFFLNFSFDNGEIIFTAANSEKVFTMDKSIDHIWEDYVRRFFKERTIAFEEL